MKELFAVLIMIFLAELGDKTQLATMMFASHKLAHPLLVFVGTSIALVAASAVAVLIGHTAGHYFAFLPLKLIVGIGFVLLGGWTILEHFGVAR